MTNQKPPDWDALGISKDDWARIFEANKPNQDEIKRLSPLSPEEVDGVLSRLLDGEVTIVREVEAPEFAAEATVTYSKGIEVNVDLARLSEQIEELRADAEAMASLSEAVDGAAEKLRSVLADLLRSPFFPPRPVIYPVPEDAFPRPDFRWTPTQRWGAIDGVFINTNDLSDLVAGSLDGIWVDESGDWVANDELGKETAVFDNQSDIGVANDELGREIAVFDSQSDVGRPNDELGSQKSQS